MRIRNSILAAAAAALLAVPSIAAAQTADTQTASAAMNPIAVQHFNVHNGAYDLVTYGHTNDANSIFIKFANESANVATKVVFDVLSDGQYQGQVTDTGEFSQGVAISHHYDNTFDDMLPLTDVTIVPVEVDYANGQVWNAPAD